MSTVLLAAPLIVFALVVLFGFAGCWLDTKGQGPPNGGNGGGGPNGGGDPDGGPPTYWEAVMNSGPIAYWRLSDPAPDPSSPNPLFPMAKDEIGAPAQQLGNHPGTYNGIPTLGVPPGLNDSDVNATPARLDGDDFVGIGQDMDYFQSTEFTVEALVRPDSVAGPTDAVVRNMSLSGGWALNLVPPPEGASPTTVGQLQAFVRAASANSIEAPLDFDQLGTAWHVAMTLNKDRLNLYLDGKEVNHLLAPMQWFAPNTTQDQLQIGTNFHGAIQEVAVYDRALDAAEILLHHIANTSPPPGP